MIFEICENFEAKYGDLGDTSEILPLGIDKEKLQPRIQVLMKGARSARRKAAKGRDYKVGRGKPPTGTQFRGKSGNPSGLPKPKDFIESFNESLLAKVIVTTRDGKAVKRPKIAISTARIFADAIKGNAKARQWVRNLIKGLHERGLLTPPPPRPRRSKPSGEEVIAFRASLTMMVSQMRGELVKVFTAKYGPVPDNALRAFFTGVTSDRRFC
jgi:hypothetical protein